MCFGDVLWQCKRVPPLTGDSRVFVVALLILARRGTHDDGAAAGAALGGERGLVGGERLHDGIAGSERLHGERLFVGGGGMLSRSIEW